MNLKEITEKIIIIEKHVSLRKQVFAGVCYWPYVRLTIYKRLQRTLESGDNVSSVKRQSLSFNLSALFGFCKMILVILSYIVGKSVDTVYVSRPEDYVQKPGGKKVDRIAEAYKKFYGSEDSILQLVTDEGLVKNNSFKGNNLILLDGVRLLAKLTSLFTLFKRKQIQRTLTKDSQLTHYLGNLNICIKSLSNEIHRIYSLAAAYRFIFRLLRPKVVIFHYFYRPTGFALSMACGCLSIKSIEYQHGIQNDYHGMYSHWTNVPIGGYLMLPEIFWLWGPEFQKKFQSLIDAGERHKLLYGGNLLLTDKLNERVKVTQSLNINSPKRRIILVSLQGDYFYKPFLVEAARQLRDYTWLFREHPRHSLSKQFKDQVENVSSKPLSVVAEYDLYELLELTDMHITATSTVALEARAFGVPNLFIDEHAVTGFGVLSGGGAELALSVEDVFLWVSSQEMGSKNIPSGWPIS